MVAEWREAAEVEREWVVPAAAAAMFDVEETDLAPRGLLERTEAERDLSPAAATVVTEAVLPSLPARRVSASCDNSHVC